MNKILVRKAIWNSHEAAPTYSLEIHPNRHIWKGAQDHSRDGPNCRKTCAQKYLLFGVLWRSQPASLAFWMAGGVVQDHNHLWNWAVFVWTATSGFREIGDAACACSKSLLMGMVHFVPLLDHFAAVHLTTA